MIKNGMIKGFALVVMLIVMVSGLSSQEGFGESVGESMNDKMMEPMGMMMDSSMKGMGGMMPENASTITVTHKHSNLLFTSYELKDAWPYISRLTDISNQVFVVGKGSRFRVLNTFVLNGEYYHEVKFMKVTPVSTAQKQEMERSMGMEQMGMELIPIIKVDKKMMESGRIMVMSDGRMMMMPEGQMMMMPNGQMMTADGQMMSDEEMMMSEGQMVAGMDHTFVIRESDFETKLNSVISAYFIRSAMSWGPILVPLKIYLGPYSLEGNTTVGYSIAFTTSLSQRGATVSFPLSFGYLFGPSDTNELYDSGLSLFTGALFGFGLSDIQIGVLGGIDLILSEAQNNPLRYWVSLGVSYEFMNRPLP